MQTPIVNCLRALVWMLIAFGVLLMSGMRPTISAWMSGPPAWTPVDPSSTAQTSGTSQHKPFPCLSYAPFRQPDWRPDMAGLIIPADVIEKDLAQIAAVSSCVRIYGTANGLDQAPHIARKLGLRVWLGVWLGSDISLNAAEMRRAVALLHTEAGAANASIERVIVGSEVLLRGDLTVPELLDYIRQMQQITSIPVAYADVWEFWLKHAQALGPQVDEAVIHILPYWENSPVALAAAADHVFDVWRRVEKALAPLPVVVGETGWPAAGRQRGGARPVVSEQRQFINDVLRRHDQMPDGSGIRLNIIEAFNQPWKAASEGVAGSAWGVLLHPPCALMSPVWMLAGLLCVTCLAICMGASRLGTAVFPFALTALVGLSSLWLSLLMIVPLQEWLGLDAASPAGLIRAAAMVFFWAWSVMEARALLPLACQAGVSSGPSVSSRMVLRETGLWGVAVYTLMLVQDGRYMDLAWPLLAMPALPWALRVWGGGIVDMRARWAVARAGLLAGSSVAIVQVEGWGNGAAVTVAMLVLLLAVTSVKQAPELSVSS